MPQGDDGRSPRTNTGFIPDFNPGFISGSDSASGSCPSESAPEPAPDHAPVFCPVPGREGRRARPARGFFHLALILLLGTTLGLSLAGCGLKKAEKPQSEQTTVDLSLGEAANAIMADLAKLSGSTQRYGELRGQSPLETRMDMNFEGPLAEALRQVCATVGFRLVEKGTETGVPLFVRVRAKDTQALHVLRIIGLQTTARERVLVREAERVIELRWANADAETQKLSRDAARKGSRASTGDPGTSTGARS